jgi:hypothetical protein
MADTAQGLTNEKLNLWSTGLNAPRTTTIQEELFSLGKSFSYEDYLLYGASETKTLVFNPLEFRPFTDFQNRLVINPFGFSASGGPILIQYYADTDSDEDGTLLGASNRDAQRATLPKSTLRLNPTINDIGTRFAGDLVPATSVSPAAATGALNVGGLPFALSPYIKYAVRITNTDGADIYVQMKMTWFEI